MSNRLKFYREQMAAFEGTADPRKAIESGYYVTEPRKSSSSLITRVALRPSATHLLIGGIGSGKTTQLWVACDQFNKIEGVYAHYIDVSLYTDISKISVNVLTAIVGLVLSQLAKDSDDEKIQEYRNLIRKKAYGYSEYIESKNQINIFNPDFKENLRMQNRHVEFLDKSLSPYYLNPLGIGKQTITPPRIVNHKGILPAQEEEAQDQLILAINYLNKYIRSIHGKIILLFDGLDRLDDAQLFSQIVIKDVQAISATEIGVVLVGPLVAAYSQYRDIIEPVVNYTSYQSCFDLENDPEAYSFFENIINVRLQKGFIEKSALLSLINYSGGVLRDLINLTQSSIEEAYVSNEEHLEKTHVETAADSFGRAKLLGVSDQDLEVLKQVAETGKFIPRTDDEIRLLVTGRILEYQYPARRFAVHPTLQPLL
jgi:hypothetical protein